MVSRENVSFYLMELGTSPAHIIIFIICFEQFVQKCWHTNNYFHEFHDIEPFQLRIILVPNRLYGALSMFLIYLLFELNTWVFLLFLFYLFILSVFNIFYSVCCFVYLFIFSFIIQFYELAKCFFLCKFLLSIHVQRSRTDSISMSFVWKNFAGND